MITEDSPLQNKLVVESGHRQAGDEEIKQIPFRSEVLRNTKPDQLNQHFGNKQPDKNAIDDVNCKRYFITLVMDPDRLTENWSCWSQLCKFTTKINCTTRTSPECLEQQTKKQWG